MDADMQFNDKNSQGKGFSDVIAREIDKLKETLLSSFAETFPERTAGQSQHTTKGETTAAHETGFCCARVQSRGASISVTPAAHSSWSKPMEPEVTELSEAEDHSLKDLEVLQERGFEEHKALSCWARFAAAATSGELEDKRQSSMPSEYFKIRPNWRAGEYKTGTSRVTIAGHRPPPNQHQMRVKSIIMDESSRFQRFVSHPDHLTRMFWLSAGMMLIFWDLITIPLVLANAAESTQEFLVTVSHFTVFFWIVDLVYNFFTGYDTGAGIEMRPGRIARNYVSTWLIPDTALVLLEVVIKLLELVAATDSEDLSSVRVLRAVRILRFLRLLRLQRITRIVEVIAKHFTSVTFWLTLRIASYLFFILVVNHYLAIFFMAIGTDALKGGAPNWLERYGIADYTFWDVYAVSLHWSLTQFTPATNNIAPVSVPERLFSIAVVLVALALFSSFLSSITNAVNALRTVRMSAASQEAQIRQFFNERNLPAPLLAQVKGFIQLRSAAIQRMREKDVKVLLELPEVLKRRLHTAMYYQHLMEIQWWPESGGESPQDYGGNSELVERVCHIATTELLASPASDIFVPDEKCAGAIVPIDHGLVYTRREVFNKHRSCAGHDNGVVSLGPYEIIADIGLWAEWTYRGHLASEVTSPYLFINAEAFAELARTMGGAAFKYLQTFGLLYLSHIEDQVTSGQLSDLCTDLETIAMLKERAECFMMVGSRNIRSSAESKVSLSNLMSWSRKTLMRTPSPR
ncbi:unnamed protein product [Durusdinium trenchii]|uniref:Ion transport domain-containing protein n=1 Tax=Durusdinium trenchii TaxID=1381693 RepID=A0ABP0HKS5_9DINO